MTPTGTQNESGEHAQMIIRNGQGENNPNRQSYRFVSWEMSYTCW